MSGAGQGDGAAPSQVEPDAVGRGWVERTGASREQALFMLAGSSLGVGDLLGGTLPEWFDLRQTANLDAVGDPVGGMQPVEMSMTDGRVVKAGWPEAFCDHVVTALLATLPGAQSDAPASTPAEPAPAAPEPLAPAPSPAAPPEQVSTIGAPADAPAPVTPAPVAPEPVAPDAVAPAPVAPEPVAPVAPQPVASAPVGSGAEAPAADPSPSDGAAAAALVLEDVTYLGGYPGQGKKRKKCTARLTRDAVEVAGPNGLAFRVPWEVVRTIEAQNADEARFRMNTKVHRDATALVLECDQEVTVLLEARDCPTIPLRSAIAQLVDDLSVVVV